MLKVSSSSHQLFAVATVFISSLVCNMSLLRRVKKLSTRLVTCSPVSDKQHCPYIITLGLTKPGSPSRPCITAMTSTSVVLAWDPPETLERIPITAYTIEYKETCVSLWHIAAGVVLNTTTVIDDLVPGKTYQFRVSANNDIGISEPSEASDSITMDLQNGKLSCSSYLVHLILLATSEVSGACCDFRIQAEFSLRFLMFEH